MRKALKDEKVVFLFTKVKEIIIIIIIEGDLAIWTL